MSRKSAEEKQKTINELRKNLKERALKAIAKDKMLYSVRDLIAVSGYGSEAWYKAFPKNENHNIPEYQEIEEALIDNRIRVKALIREKMLQSTYPAALIALYRLLGTTEEREALNMGMDVEKAKAANNTANKDAVIKLEIK